MLALAPAPQERSTSGAQAPQGEAALARWFDALAGADWSLRGMEDALPAVLQLADALHPPERTTWLSGLRRIWQRQGWALSDTQLAALVALTLAWGDWPLLIEATLTLERRRPLSAPEARGVVVALRQMGELELAGARCRSRMFAHSQENWPLTEHHALLRVRKFRECAAPVVDGERLRLEPLGHHHAQDFAAQYYDPAIGELCCLPQFASNEQWHCWLDACWGYGDQHLYAVIDFEWGFVGSVSLIVHDRIGFFYYWVGRDFQGCGIGTAAVRLLLDAAAECHGLHTCYAKVFDYNTPSRRALEKLGFTALDIRAAPPNADELFYRLGAEQPRQRSADELRTLLESMESETRVAVPMAVSDIRRRHAGGGSRQGVCR